MAPGGIYPQSPSTTFGEDDEDEDAGVGIGDAEEEEDDEPGVGVGETEDDEDDRKLMVTVGFVPACPPKGDLVGNSVIMPVKEVWKNPTSTVEVSIETELDVECPERIVKAALKRKPFGTVKFPTVILRWVS